MLKRCFALKSLIVLVAVWVLGGSVAEASTVVTDMWPGGKEHGSVRFPSVAVSGDGRVVAIMDEDVSLWDGRSGRKLQRVDSYYGEWDEAIGLSRTGRYLAYAHELNRAPAGSNEMAAVGFDLWDARRRRRLRLERSAGGAHRLDVVGVGFSRDEKRLAYTIGSTLIVRATSTGGVICKIPVDEGTAGCLSPNGRLVAFERGGRVVVSDIASGKSLRVAESLARGRRVGASDVSYRPRAIWFAGNGTLRIAGWAEEGEELVAWFRVESMDLRTGQITWAEIPGRGHKLTHGEMDGVSIIGDDTLVISGCLDDPAKNGSTTFWDCRTGALVGREPYGLFSFFSDNGRTMVYTDVRSVLWFRCQVKHVGMPPLVSSRPQ